MREAPLRITSAKNSRFNEEGVIRLHENSLLQLYQRANAGKGETYKRLRAIEEVVHNRYAAAAERILRENFANGALVRECSRAAQVQPIATLTAV